MQSDREEVCASERRSRRVDIELGKKGGGEERRAKREGERGRFLGCEVC